MPPVWPPVPGTQQMQQHLDILVDDLAAAAAVAEEAGAEFVGGHEDGDEIVRVYRDRRPPLLPVRCVAGNPVAP